MVKKTGRIVLWVTGGLAVYAVLLWLVGMAGYYWFGR
jgi:hypothetical protein